MNQSAAHDKGEQPECPSAAEMRAVADTVRQSRHGSRRQDRSQRAAELEERCQAFMTEGADPLFAQHAIEAVRRAAALGDRRVRIYSFPSEFCKDRGRAINNDAVDWGMTLCGQAADILAILESEFSSRGYQIMAQIITWPDQMPGDVGLFLSWESGGS